METMTKLEREQSNKLLELDDTIDAMFSRENEHQGIIQQLRDELAAVTERAERAEGEMRLQMRQADKATKERDEALAKVKRADYHAATESMKSIADALGYGNMYAFRDVANDAIACIKEWHKRTKEAPQQQPGELLFDGVRWVTEMGVSLLGKDTGSYTVAAKPYGSCIVPVHVTIRKAGE